MLNLSKQYRTTVTLEGEPIRILVKKLEKTEDLEFSLGFEEIGREFAAAQQEMARFTRHEIERLKKDGASDADIAQLTPIHFEGLFEATLLPEAKEARRQEVRRREARDGQFLLNAIASYLSVEPGQIYDEDENREITSGADLVKHFQSRPDVLQLLVGKIFTENRLTTEQKKRLSSLSDSAPISAPSSTGSGPTPDGTAPPAVSSNTANRAPAKVRRERSPSGVTTSSSATSVPS